MRKILKNGKVIFDEIEAAKALLYGIPLDQLFVEIDISKLPKSVQQDLKKNISLEDFSLEEIEKRKQTFFMPKEYEKIDLRKYFLNLISSEEEKQRVLQEIELIEKTNSTKFFQYLIYLSDIIKAYDIVIGVGRGSSVSLYILYLLGLHRVDSLKYNLDPNEFFKI